jgi:hypothetical protein
MQFIKATGLDRKSGGQRKMKMAHGYKGWGTRSFVAVQAIRLAGPPSLSSSALTLFPLAPIITAGPVIISVRVSSSHLLPDALAR